MTSTMRIVNMEINTELTYIEARLINEGDVFLTVNYGGIEGFTVDDARFGENQFGRRTVEIEGINGERVVVDPKEIITVVRTTVGVATNA